MKGRVDAVLFDLDNTLVNSKTLKKFRESRDRQGLTDALKSIKPYKNTTALLEGIKKKGILLGLITNSPRWYAEKVISHIGIELFDVVITYDDVGPNGIKPSPEGINKAIIELGLNKKNNIIYIGDEFTDMNAAYYAGVKPIAPSWASRDPISQMPAAVMCTNNLLRQLDSFENIALIADLSADKGTFQFEKEQLNFAPLDQYGNVVSANRDEIFTVCFGRYFSQSGLLTSSYHQHHNLSKTIYEKEKNSTFVAPEYWVDLLSKAITSLPKFFLECNQQFDIITVIPSKKGRNPRLENLLSRIERNAKHSSDFIKDIFYFDDDAQSLKSLGNKERREEEVNNKLHLKKKYQEYIRGKKVVVIDDVITTGSTLRRASNLLLDNGAERVINLCLAKTVSVIEDFNYCPECGKVMKIRRNKKNIPFWACSGYFDKINKCTHTEPVVLKPCPSNCGGNLITKSGSSLFAGCTSYPKCMYTEKLE